MKHYAKKSLLALTLVLLFTVFALALASCGDTEPDKYTVEFYVDGELYKSIEVDAGSAPEVPKDLSAEKYNPAVDAEGKPYDFSLSLNDLADGTLKLYVTTKTYTVTYVSGSETVTETVKYGQTAPERTLDVGYEAWTLNGEAYDFTTEVKSDLTLTASLKMLKVSFVTEEGKTEEKYVAYGSAVDALAVAEGHGAWTLDGKAYDFESAVVSDLVLNSALKVYNVTFETEEGEDVTVPVKHGHKVDAAEYDAASHTAWTQNGEAYDFETPVVSDLVLNSALKVYDVTFETEEGEDVTVSVKHGHNVDAAQYDAVSHMAWALNGEAYDFEAAVVSDMTLVSALKSYTVRYEVEDGDTVTVTVKHGHLAEVKDTARGHEAWTQNGEVYDFETPVTADVSLYSALSVFDVNFYGKNDALLHTYAVKYGYTVEAYNEPGVLSWLDEYGEGYDFSARVYDDLDLFASWDRFTVAYHIADDNEPDGYKIVTATVLYGDLASGAAVIPEHHVAWTLNDAKGEAYNAEAPVTSNLVLYSDWEWFTVEYQFNGEKVDSLKATLHYGQSATDPKLAGQNPWRLGENAYDFSEIVESSLVLESEYKTLNVTFRYETLDDDELYKTVNVTYNDKLSVEDEIENHGAWLLNGEEYDFDAVVTENLELYAKLDVYTVTFETEEKATVTVDVKHGAAVAAKDVLEGYQAWKLDGTDYDFSNPVTSDITLVSNLKVYTVTFEYYNKNGVLVSDLTSSVEVKHGKHLSEEQVPQNVKYNNWLGADGEEYDFNENVTGNVVVHANVKTFTVTFTTIKGTNANLPVSVTLEYGDVVEVPESVVYNENYTAWSTSRNYGGEAYDMKAEVTENLDLYAYVKQYTVTLHYVSALGELPKDTTVTVYADDNSKVEDLIIMQAYESVKCGEEAVSGDKVVTGDITLDLTPKTFNINYHYASDTIVANPENIIVEYDITTAYNIETPDVGLKNYVFKGWNVGSASGALLSEDSIRSMNFDGAYTDLELYASMKAAELNVTSAATGLTVASGVLSIGNDATFKAWLEENDGDLVIPATVDGNDVVNVKLGAFASQKGIKAVYVFDGMQKFLDNASAAGAATTHTFFNCGNLSKVVVISDTITALGKGTFGYNTVVATKNNSITSAIVVLSQNLANDGYWFANDINLKYAYVRISGNTVPQYLFYFNDRSNTSRLEYVDFETAATTVNNYLFNGCANLKTAKVNFTTFTGASNGTNMFNGCTSLEKLTFNAPKMTKLPSNTFYNCSKLNMTAGEFNAPKLTTIDSSAFYGCAKFAPTIGMFNEVTTLNSSAFSGCAALNPVGEAGVYLFPKATTLAGSLFQNCAGLTSIDNLFNWQNITLTTSQSNMFNGCTGLESVTLNVADGSVLPSSFFAGCTNLKSFALAEGVALADNGIKSSVFQNCTSLETVGIDFSVFTSIDGASSLFDGAGSGSIVLNLNDAITKLPSAIFQKTTFTDVTINAKGLNELGYTREFNMSEKMKTLTINHESDTFTFKGNAIYNCSALEELDIAVPKSGAFSAYKNGSSMQMMNFYGCNSLRVVTHMEAYTEAIMEYASFNNTSPIGSYVTVYNYGATSNNPFFPFAAPLFAPDPETHLIMWTDKMVIGVSHDAYKTVTGSNGSISYVDKDDETIKYTSPIGNEDRLLKLAEGYAGVVSIPSTVKYIFSGAFNDNGNKFNGAINITGVDMSKATGLVSIGTYAFAYLDAETIVVPDSVEAIGGYAFSFMPNVKSITLPANEKYTVIAPCLMYSCGEKLTTVTIPKYVTTLGYGAFSGSTNSSTNEKFGYIEKIEYTDPATAGKITGVGSYLLANGYGDVQVYDILSKWTAMKTIPENFVYGANGIKGEAVEGEEYRLLRIPAQYEFIGAQAFQFNGIYKEDADKTEENLLYPMKVVFEADKDTEKILVLGGNSAFGSATNPVRVVEFQEGITKIGKVLYMASNVKEVKIPASVTEFGDCNYSTNSTTGEITYSFKTTANTSSGNGAFQGCYALEKVSIAEGSQLTMIGASTFASCKELTELSLPNTITMVGGYAFDSGNDNQFMKLSMNVNWSLDYLGQTAFRNMPYLSGTITLSSKALTGLSSMQKVFYFNKPNYDVTLPAQNELTVNLVMPTTAVQFPNYFAAYRNVHFNTVDGENTLNDTIKYVSAASQVGQYAFTGNPYLKSFVQYSDTSKGTGVGDYAFQNCSALTCVDLYSKTTNSISIGSKAFEDCANLVYFAISNYANYGTSASNNPFIGAFANTAEKTVTIKIYSTANTGADYKSIRNNTSAFTATTVAFTPWYVANSYANHVNIVLCDGVKIANPYAFPMSPDKLTFFVEATASPITSTSNNGGYTDAAKYLGKGTTWDYGIDGLPVAIATEE